MARCRIGWASWALMGYLVRRALHGSQEFSLDTFDSHEALLAADNLAPFDVIVLRAKDPLNAERVRDELRARSPRMAIALCSGCNCAGGIKGAHGIDPDSFDRLFWNSGSYSRVAAWLVSLTSDDPIAEAVARARSLSELPDAYLDLPDGERLWAADTAMAWQRRAEPASVLPEWHAMLKEWLRHFSKVMGAHWSAATTDSGQLGAADLSAELADEAETFLLRLSQLNVHVVYNLLRASADVAIEATREAIQARTHDELDECFALFFMGWRRALDEGLVYVLSAQSKAASDSIAPARRSN